MHLEAKAIITLLDRRIEKLRVLVADAAKSEQFKDAAQFQAALNALRAFRDDITRGEALAAP